MRVCPGKKARSGEGNRMQSPKENPRVVATVDSRDVKEWGHGGIKGAGAEFGLAHPLSREIRALNRGG